MKKSSIALIVFSLKFKEHLSTMFSKQLSSSPLFLSKTVKLEVFLWREMCQRLDAKTKGGMYDG